MVEDPVQKQTQEENQSFQIEVTSMQEVRCEACGKKLGHINGQAEIKCPRCGHINYIDTEEVHETQPT